MEMKELYRPPAAAEPTAQLAAEWAGGELRDAPNSKGTFAGLATIGEAGPRDITFVGSEKFVNDAKASRAGLLITGRNWDVPGRPRVVVEEVWEAVARLMNQLYPPPKLKPGIHPTAIVGDHVIVGDDVYIGPWCVLGDGCRIADGVVIGPHCVLDEGCVIGRDARLVARVTLIGPVSLGERVLIHPGAVLGADGFKFELVRGQALKIPQVGRVVVEDDVEIGANTTIDRAFLYETRIGRGAKLDNLVQIAHNVHVGEGCLMAAQVGVAGSARIGPGCMMGGQAGIRDGAKIGGGVVIGAQAGVHTDLLEPGMFLGSPAIPIKDFWRVAAAQNRLPEYAKKIRELEKKIEKLESGDQS